MEFYTDATKQTVEEIVQKVLDNQVEAAVEATEEEESKIMEEQIGVLHVFTNDADIQALIDQRNKSVVEPLSEDSMECAAYDPDDSTFAPTDHKGPELPSLEPSYTVTGTSFEDNKTFTNVAHTTPPMPRDELVLPTQDGKFDPQPFAPLSYSTYGDVSTKPIDTLVDKYTCKMTSKTDEKGRTFFTFDDGLSIQLFAIIYKTRNGYCVNINDTLIPLNTFLDIVTMRPADETLLVEDSRAENLQIRSDYVVKGQKVVCTTLDGNEIVFENVSIRQLMYAQTHFTELYGRGEPESYLRSIVSFFKSFCR